MEYSVGFALTPTRPKRDEGLRKSPDPETKRTAEIQTEAVKSQKKFGLWE